MPLGLAPKAWPPARPSLWPQLQADSHEAPHDDVACEVVFKHSQSVIHISAALAVGEPAAAQGRDQVRGHVRVQEAPRCQGNGIGYALPVQQQVSVASRLLYAAMLMVLYARPSKGCSQHPT